MSEQCRALNNQGFRCRRRDTMEVSYHGDDELYNWSGNSHPTWVQVPFCSLHRDKDEKPHKAKRKKDQCESTK